MSDAPLTKCACCRTPLVWDDCHASCPRGCADPLAWRARAETRSPDAYNDATCWARTWRRAEYTMGEADAYRAGVAAAQRKLYAYAENLRACVTSRIDDTADITRANASAIEIAADMLGRIEPSCEPDGLSERGA